MMGPGWRHANGSYGMQFSFSRSNVAVGIGTSPTVCRTRRQRISCYCVRVMGLGRHSRRTQRMLAVVRAAAALLVLFTITADIVADSRCHPPAHIQAREVLRGPAPSAANQDPCRTGCVPDCYCCSQSVTRGPAVLPPDAGPATVTLPLLLPAAPAGVRPVPYRPPLDLA
jgi:hypothetical protein